MMGERIEPRSEIANLNHSLSAVGLRPLEPATEARFDAYLSLILRWNACTNLTSIRDVPGIVNRHFVESIACAQLLPQEIRSLLDFGSGAGFPGIPIALCRPEVSVTLAESQTRKASFLREAVRTLGLNSKVWQGRAEKLDQRFDCVTLRAVDRMDQAVAAGAGLVQAGGWLAILTTQPELPRMQKSTGKGFQWLELHPLPGSERRLIAIASRTGEIPGDQCST